MKSGLLNILNYQSVYFPPGAVIHIAEFQVREKRIKEGSILAAERICRIEYLKAMSEEELMAATRLFDRSGRRINYEEAWLIALCRSRDLSFMLTEQSIRMLCFQEGVMCFEARTIETKG